jgi:hypothetical protein
MTVSGDTGDEGIHITISQARLRGDAILTVLVVVVVVGGGEAVVLPVPSHRQIAFPTPDPYPRSLALSNLSVVTEKEVDTSLISESRQSNRHQRLKPHVSQDTLTPNPPHSPPRQLPNSLH